VQIPDFKLERYFARWEFVSPFVLGSSDAESWRLQELLALAERDALARWNNLWLGYTENAGHSLLRAEIAALYPGLGAEDVIVYSGAEEAIFAFINVAVHPGDHVVAVWPCYQSLAEVAKSAGATVTRLELKAEKGWRLDLAELESCMTPSTKAVIVNVPHSPTGMLVDHQTFSQLAMLCEQRGAVLFCDEVYRYGEYDESDRLPGACEMSTKGVSLGALSKPFGLAGLRIGWLALRDRALRQRLAAFKDYTSKILAIIALRAKDTLLDRNMSIVKHNLALLETFFAHHASMFEWVTPRAGTVGFPRLRSSIPVEEFAKGLLEKTGVLIAPGSLFDHPHNHFRIGFGRRNMPEALDRLAAYLEREAALV
jgi:aspartate/methionine/tyrosine aminotransferase